MLDRLMKSALVLLVALVMFSGSSAAQEPTLKGNAETRARALFKELRCVVCQNQSIDGSNADVARDLRQIVREQIESGKSNEEIKGFLVARYGEFVLLKPRFATHTYFLWLAPLLLLLVGLAIIARALWMRKRAEFSASSAALSQEEQSALDEILSRSNRNDPEQ